MFLQLMTFIFAIQWLGSPWQLGFGKALLASIFFLVMVSNSVLPTVFREWGNLKKQILLYALLKIVFLVLCVFIPGIGEILDLIFNIICLCLPLTFYKKISFGFILFVLWFAGINHLLGLSILEDPRGYFSGDVFLSLTDWAILGTFLLALARCIYHIRLNYPMFRLYESYDISYILSLASASSYQDLKTRLIADINQIKGTLDTETRQLLDEGLSGTTLVSLSETGKKQLQAAFKSRFGGAIKLLKSDTEGTNQALKAQERNTLKFVALFAIGIIGVSTFIKPGYKQEAIPQLQAGYKAVMDNDTIRASEIADSFYNDKQILYNGDVFLLKGIVTAETSPEEAIPYFEKAAGWFDHHKSWIAETHHSEAYYELAKAYADKAPPDYSKARKAIKSAVSLDSLNEEYTDLQDIIIAKVSSLEQEKKPGFFKILWNNLRSK